MQSTTVSPLIWLVAAQLLLYAVGWLMCSAMVPEERAATLHWGGFALLVGIGLVLAAQRGEPRGWWAYCGSNVFTVLSYIALRRGAELFVRVPPRDIEHALTAAVLVGALLLFGAGAPSAPWRVLFVYAASTLVLVRALTTVYGPIRAEFGRRVAYAIMPSGMLVAAMFLLRGVQQAFDMSKPLEFQSATAGNAPMLVGYLVGAALFNFGFLSLLIMRLVQRLRELSQRDPLTGLLNRRALDLELEREWRRFSRSGTLFAVLAVDIDHFKRVNDTHGHAGGDAMLACVAQQLRACARETDVVARTGGEEFVVLLTGVQARGAVEAAQRVRQAVAAGSVLIGGAPVSVTVSVGLAMPRPHDLEPAALLGRADQMLYRAKAAGRDRVCSDDEAVGDNAA